MNELLELEAGLHRGFSEAVSAELPSKLKEFQVSRTGSLLHALTSLIVLPYGALVGLKDILVSGLRVFQQDALATDIQGRIDERVTALKRRAAMVMGEEKPTLLNFVEELKAQYIKQLHGGAG